MTPKSKDGLHQIKSTPFKHVNSIQSQRRVARELEEEEEEMTSTESVRDTKGGCERERVSSVMELNTPTLLHNHHLYFRFHLFFTHYSFNNVNNHTSVLISDNLVVFIEFI